MTPPVGAGVFLWLPLRCEGGSLDALVAKAVASGLGWIALHNFCDPHFVSAFKAAGLWVAYSSYSTPDGTAAFIASAKRAVGMGVDGVLVDAETPWETAADGKTVARRGPEARAFMQALRAAVGNVYLADAGAWAEPKFHPTYPDLEFGEVCDAAMPERYWTESALPYDAFIGESEREWAIKAPLYKTVIPIGSGYGTNGPVPGGRQPLTPADFASFIGRYPTFGLWSWMHLPSWAWDALRLTTSRPYTTPIATPEIDLETDPDDTIPPPTEAA